MTNLIVTLLGGIVFIVAVFVLIYRFSSLSGKATAAIVALAVVGIYVPVSIVFWPGADVFAIHIALYLVSVYLLGIVSSQRDANKKKGLKPGGIHWGPASIIGFFVILVMADSMFIMFAQTGMSSDVARWLLPRPASGGKVSSHFPGTVSHDFHEKQEQYNEYLKRFNKQKMLNWKVRKGWLSPPVTGKSAIFRVELSDDKNLIANADVSGKFLRPANSKLDQAFKMQQVEPGIYQSSITLTERGNWDLVLIIVKGDDMHEIRAKTTVK